MPIVLEIEHGMTPCLIVMGWQVALVDLQMVSNAGDWMLPNRRELQSLVDVSNNNPSLPSGHPFYNVVNAWYWSSTTLLDPIHEVAYYVHIDVG